MTAENEIDYGKLTKRIIFMDNDHRHAKMTVRLKHDKMTMAAFFRHLMTGYIEADERIMSYLDDVRPISQKHKKKSKQLRDKGQATLKDFGLSDGEVENIFDLIEEEHPEL